MRERADMLVFGAVPAFRRLSLLFRGLEPNPRAARSLVARLGPDNEIEAVAEQWQAAYRAVGLDSDAICPVTALAAWAESPQGLPSQGPIPDTVNAFALMYGVPTAAYDPEAVVDALWLRPSRGIEHHEPLVGGAESPSVGELILVDSEDRVFARRWHGSPGRPAMPTDDATTCLVHIDTLGASDEALDELARAFEALARGLLGGKSERRTLDRQSPEAVWPAD